MTTERLRFWANCAVVVGVCLLLALLAFNPPISIGLIVVAIFAFVLSVVGALALLIIDQRRFSIKKASLG